VDWVTWWIVVLGVLYSRLRNLVDGCGDWGGGELVT
jgi:hypothetical protein